MGMTIDVDSVKEILHESEERITNNISDKITTIIRENYIPKADYEARLKADMVAMLKDVVQNIEEIRTAPSIISDDNAQNLCTDIISLIQDKANSYLLTTDSQKVYTVIDIATMLRKLQSEIEEMSGLVTEIHGEKWEEKNMLDTQELLLNIQEKIDELKAESEE